MTLWKKPKKREQSVEQFSKYIPRHLATLIYRAGQFVRQNRVASTTAGLLLISLLGGVIATTWQAHRAKVAKARADQLSDGVRQLAHSRPVNDYDALDNLTGLPRIREGRQDALATDLRHDLADVHNSQGSAIEGYRDTTLEDHRMVPATYEELGADNPRDRTYRRIIPMAYANPGRVLYLTSVDPAALGPYAGDYLVLINNPRAALDAFRKRLAIDEQAVAADPGNLQVQTDLAYSSSRIGDLLAEMGDQAGALSYYQRAVDIYTKTAAADPQDFATPLQLSRLLGKLAKTHASLGYIEKAWAECNRAADLLESVVVDAANVEQGRVRASAYSEIADAYSQLARDTRTPQQSMKQLWAAAREMYKSSLWILIDLRKRGVLNADELTEIDSISHKIAECDLFLAK